MLLLLLRGPALAAATRVACPTHISVSSASSWADSVAESLEVNGFCVLSSSEGDSAESPLIPLDVVDNANVAAASRLETYLSRVENRGIARSDDFAFAEVVHRDGLRYDMPLPYCDPSANSAGSIRYTPRAGVCATRGGDAFAKLHEAVDAVAQPIIDAVLERRGGTDERGTQSPKAGCVLSVPSASAQSWHSDGGEEGLLNVFVPLCDLTRSNGPTEFRPGTHKHSDGSARGFVKPRVAPLLNAGEVRYLQPDSIRCSRTCHIPHAHADPNLRLPLPPSRAGQRLE